MSYFTSGCNVRSRCSTWNIDTPRLLRSDEAVEVETARRQEQNLFFSDEHAPRLVNPTIPLAETIPSPHKAGAGASVVSSTVLYVRPAVHPVWRCCSSLTYAQDVRSSRLSSLAQRYPGVQICKSHHTRLAPFEVLRGVPAQRHGPDAIRNNRSHSTCDLLLPFLEQRRPMLTSNDCRSVQSPQEEELLVSS